MPMAPALPSSWMKSKPTWAKPCEHWAWPSKPTTPGAGVSRLTMERHHENQRLAGRADRERSRFGHDRLCADTAAYARAERRAGHVSDADRLRLRHLRNTAGGAPCKKQAARSVATA